MAESNTFKPGWFRGKECRGLAAAYYRTLRSIRRSHPSEAALVQCRECEILFLTTIRNRNRKDLRCPTGCRRKREAESSAQRAAAYYRTTKGQLRKKAHNRRRNLRSTQAKRCQENDNPPHDIITSFLLNYYRWVIRLIEGVLMDLSQLKVLVERIRAKVSQRSRDGARHFRYIRDD